MRAPLAFLLTLLALGAPAVAEAARVETKDATAKVQRWTSPKAFNSPVAVVDIRHEGKLLEGTAVDRCRRTYADKDIAVQIGTCGQRWRVRAVYVSMSGREERFRIIYASRG
jgi:hypothetical protein